ncbi:MAG: YhcH/YjgK/YiaL family protein [Ignavibacteria bacterium]|nr:YhcH/YjgK/YiaL family protein [Ignavibacteria bacterium]
MITGNLSHFKRYLSIHPSFILAEDFLSRARASTPEQGRYDIEGDNIYAMVSTATGKNREDAKPEAHRIYIDIHCVLNGREEIGIIGTDNCKRILSPYDSEKDFILFDEQPEFFLLLQRGDFAIVFPEDAHAPMISGDNVTKCVIKIRL